MVPVSDSPCILLVEDQADDVVLARLASRAAGLGNPISAVHDGSDAISYLSGEGQYGNRSLYPIPAMILLDLKMPKIDGFGVLKWLQNRTELDHIPVIILTSSNLESDIARAEALGADEYIVKPNDHADLVLVFKKLSVRWLVSPSLGQP
jgi:CheY-like chemotaxis protein